MPVALYFDHHVSRAMALSLRMKSVDVITAYEDGSHLLDDSSLLDRASQLNRVLFSQDEDLLVEAVGRQRAGVRFAGVIYAHQIRVPMARCIQDLEMIAKVCRPEDMANAIQYLPI